MTKLAAKAEAYARERAAGKGLSAAYRASRDTSRMATSTINSNAKRLERKPAVKVRIEELRRESKTGDFSRGIARAGARESRESSTSSEPSGASRPTPDLAAKAEEPKPCEAPKPSGRPSIYSEEIASAILARLSTGEALRTICRDAGMPDESTVRAWALDPKHPMAARYAQAREMGFFSLADELLEIADDARNDWMDKVGKAGDVMRVIDEEAISRSKLRIAARQWLLAKALPHAFGDKVEHSGLLQVKDLTPKAPPRDVLEGYAAKYLGAIEKFAPTKAAQPDSDEET